MKLNKLLLVLILLTAFSVSAQEYSNWLPADGYRLLDNHQNAFKNTLAWAEKNGFGSDNYYYVYSISETDRGFEVYIITSDNPVTKRQAMPGGLVVIYIDKNGEIYDEFWGA